ncbi:MAG TPA: type II toxin-antitoxin system death-on-curing family toxin [Acidobacteriota bacterium]|nr:type II toxin-antitoxin system death-on-curing family toxin [Acidobacteriota bacterium]
MVTTLFPSLEEALYFHSEIIARFGGSPGIRDLGLLESALARPRSGYYSSLSEQAAALMQSLALNHAFVGGNKRLAFGLAAVFLSINGFRTRVTPQEGEAFVVKRIIANRAELEEITDWLESHMSPAQ